MAIVQAIPLYRVVLSVGFCGDSLQLKPVCGWAPDTKKFRFAMSANLPPEVVASTQAFNRYWSQNARA